jgi:hypothetical protein
MGTGQVNTLISIKITLKKPFKTGLYCLFGAQKSQIDPMARAKRHYIPDQIWHTPVKWSSNLTG